MLPEIGLCRTGNRKRRLAYLMNRMQSLVRFLAVAFLLFGVAASSSAGRGEGAFGRDAWRDEVSARGLDPETVVYPFSATPEMQVWAAEAAVPAMKSEPLRQLANLQRAFFEEGVFDFSYDDSRTLTAQEAFTARRGNCMSFTSLFIAMSRSLGISTFLMEVDRAPEIGRDGGLVVVNRHVVAAYGAGPQISTFDFFLASAAPVIGQEAFDDVRASALHHNNLGANALRADRLDEARTHLEIATVLAPDWSAAWVNLGVLRSHLDEIEGAFEAYHRALEVDEHDSSALNNLSILYRKLGREEEAQVALMAAVEHGNNPFNLVALADSEMARGSMDTAEQYLRRARRWFSQEPEVWEGLARHAARSGDEAREKKCRRRAEELRRQESAEPVSTPPPTD